MAIYDFFLSRNNNVTAETYVGHEGRLFYDSEDGLFRLSDGSTPGGRVVANLSIATSQPTPPPLPRVGELWYNPLNNELLAYYNNEWKGTINVATADTLGGVKLGPGVVTNAEGQIIIDSEGLDFSFGNFAALTEIYPAGHPKEGDEFAVLQTINDDEDAVIASNGTGAVKIVGEFAIYPANGSVAGSMLESPVLSVSAEGDISATSLDIQETGDLGLMAALNVTLNAAGLTKTPAVVSGSVAQFTGRDDRTALLVVDTYGIDTARTLTGGELTFRTGRGTNASTTAVQSGDRLGEVTAAGWASNGYGGIGVGGLRILANENFTPTARGSKLQLYVVPNGTLTPTTIATVDNTGITLESGKVLTGNVTGTADIATTVTLVATNTTAATHYLTFVDAATGNENVRTDTSLTYNPGTNVLTVTSGTVTASTGTFTQFSGKWIRNTRDAGTIPAGGTLTIDFTTDGVVYCVWGDGMTINYQNYLAGSVVRVIARKATGTGVDTFSLDGLTAAQTSTGSTTSGKISADTTAFVELTCTGTTIGSVYAKY